jgi:hypothetical protein
VKENIAYENSIFSFPKEVYTFKKGDCLGDSYLIQQFLRMCDIPAVVCVGWRGNLVEVIDKDFINNEDYPRHAWVEAYIDGKWMLYDILFDVYAETDRKFITEWYFFECVEGISPYYDKNAIDWHFGGSACFYKNGRFYCYENGKPGSEVWLFWSDMYQQMRALSYMGNNGYSYLDPTRKNPENGEAFYHSLFRFPQPQGDEKPNEDDRNQIPQYHRHPESRHKPRREHTHRNGDNSAEDALRHSGAVLLPKDSHCHRDGKNQGGTQHGAGDDTAQQRRFPVLRQFQGKGACTHVTGQQRSGKHGRIRPQE